MEQICKVDICGIAGVVNEQKIGENRVLRISVAVNENYGSSVHTNWFQVVWWPEKSDTRTFGRGDIIHAEGRLISNEYTNPQGETCRVYEIKAQKIW